jgi:L-threonylcarbamoyladenylate synthase
MTAGPEEIAQAVARLRAGGLVAFPTETVYGLGADALNSRAVEAVFIAKGRPAHNPLIVHVADEPAAARLVAFWPPDASKLARAFWPGPLTIVLPKSAGIPDAVTAGGPTVAVRCPAHHVALALLAAFGGPLVGPSANPSGTVSPTTAEHVRQSFSPDEVMVLDGGPCRAGIESTVVTLAEDPPRILRPGVISADELASVLGRSGIPADSGPRAAPEASLESPGRLPVHYAPRARATLIDTADLGPLLARTRDPLAVLSYTLTTVSAPHTLLRMPTDAAAYAARLYAALRQADAINPTLIAIERPPTTGSLWHAIADRLARATGGKS